MLKSGILFLGLFQLIGSLVAVPDCGLPGIPFGGLLNGKTNWDGKTRFPPGTRVYFTCSRSDQQLLDGNDSRVCKEDGTWSANLPWCATNVLLNWPVVLNVSSHGQSMSRTLHGLSDGIESTDQSDHCLTVSGGDKHAFTFGLKKFHWFAALWIHTEDPFPLKANHWSISSSAKWPYRISRRKTSPSIVIQGAELHKGKQFTAAIKSDRSFGICELQLFASTGRLACGMPEIPANGRVSVKNRRNGQVARYGCRKGYQLDGPSVRFCNGTRWDGVQATCAPIRQVRRATDAANGTSTTDSSSAQSLRKEYQEKLRKLLSEMRRMFIVSALAALLLGSASIALIVSLRNWKLRRAENSQIE